MCTPSNHTYHDATTHPNCGRGVTTDDVHLLVQLFAFRDEVQINDGNHQWERSDVEAGQACLDMREVVQSNLIL